MGLKPLASGVIFRQEIEAGSELGRLAKGYIDRGELVPNDVTIGMMAERIGVDEVRRSGFVLDGFPRTVPQAEALDDMLARTGMDLDRAVILEVDDEVVVRRLSGRSNCPQCGAIYHRDSKPPRQDGVCDQCGSALQVRSDDQPETIRERLRVYRQNTAPLADYYAGKGLLLRVDAAGDPEAVYAAIADGLGA